MLKRGSVEFDEHGVIFGGEEFLNSTDAEAFPEEVGEFAKRRSRKLKKISESVDEPDYLASGTQKSIEDICQDNENDGDQTN
ncbi:hypothetical protein [Hahella chejuensis]|nr:hypothetical protein [Hahella chejuensis]